MPNKFLPSHIEPQERSIRFMNKQGKTVAEFKPYPKTQCQKTYTDSIEMNKDIDGWIQRGELPIECS